MNETYPPPQQDDTKASNKAFWIKPELIQLTSQDTEGKYVFNSIETAFIAPS